MRNEILPSLQIIHMITHSNKKIKKELMAPLHLNLHRPTPHKDIPCPNNHRQIMSAQLRVRIRRMVIGIPSRRQDHANRDPTLETLLAKCKELEIFQAVLLGCAVDNGVPEDYLTNSGVEHGCFA